MGSVSVGICDNKRHSVDSKLIAVIMLIVGIVVPVVMFMGAAKNRGV